jgi:hypothetical protein
MIGDRNAANLGQMLIYQYVVAIGTEEGETDRRGLVNQLELRRCSQGFDLIGTIGAAVHR